jgi:hypothetical protein
VVGCGDVHRVQVFFLVQEDAEVFVNAAVGKRFGDGRGLGFIHLGDGDELQFLLAVSAWMSEPAWPLAPKLACSTVSLGAAWACNRHTNGAAIVAAVALRAVRRVIRFEADMGISREGGIRQR